MLNLSCAGSFGSRDALLRLSLKPQVVNEAFHFIKSKQKTTLTFCMKSVKFTPIFLYSSENRSCFLTEDTREIGKVTVGAIIDNCFVPKPSEQLQSSILQHHGRLRHEGWSKPRRTDTLRQFLIGRCLIKNYSTFMCIQFMHFCSYINL